MDYLKCIQHNASISKGGQLSHFFENTSGQLYYETTKNMQGTPIPI